MPVKPKEIRISGGMSKSEAWCRTIADVFECDVVPVEGEGAALGAALHAAWVYSKESGSPVPLKELTSAFVVLDEKRRKKPVSENVQVHQIQKQLFHALSARVRGETGEDPFALRAKLLV